MYQVAAAALYYLIIAACLYFLVWLGSTPNNGASHNRFSEYGPSFILALGPVAELSLIADPFAAIRNDFLQHAAQAAQYADGLRAGDLFPRAVHSDAMVGDIQSLYYGRIFYLLTSLLSIVLGGVLAMKLAACLAATVQIASTFYLWFSITRQRLSAACVAVISSASIYQFNNMFVRGGITEFVATSVLFTATAMLIMFFIRFDRPMVRGIQFGFTWGFVAQTHPITVINGSVAFAVTSLYFLFYNRRKIHRFLYFTTTAAVVFIVIASPWIYINLFAPAGIFNFFGAKVFRLQRYPGVDELLLRLIPLPINGAKLDRIGQSYFVTQINSVLLMFYVGLIFVYHNMKRMYVSVFIVVAFLYLIVSTSSLLDPLLDVPLFRPFAMTQFAYRLVTYVNLFIYIACVAAVILPKIANWEIPPLAAKRTEFVACVLLLLTLVGAAMNAVSARGLLVGTPGFLRPEPSRADLAAYALSWGCFFAQSHATSGSEPATYCSTKDKDVKLAMGRTATENPPPRQVSPPDKGERALTTNVVFHSWNRIWVNNQACDCYGERRFTTIRNLGHTSAQVRYEFLPDRIYVVLDVISIALFFVVGLFVLFGLGRPLRELVTSSEPVTPPKA